jgi:hypothetical protein
MKFSGYKNWLNEEESSIIKYLNDAAKVFGEVDNRQGKYWKWKASNAKLLKNVHTDEIRKQYPEIDEYLKRNKTQIIQKQCAAM